VLNGALLNRTHSASVSENTTVGTSETHGSSTSQSESRTVNRNNTTTRTDGQTINKTTGNSQQISLEVHDKTIENLLAKIDHHLERVNEARTYGGWQTAAYFIGDSTASSESLASIFLGLMRGTRSSTEDFALTTWNSQSKRPILDWLSVLAHPPLKPTIAAVLAIDWLTRQRWFGQNGHSVEPAPSFNLQRRGTAHPIIRAKSPAPRRRNLTDNRPEHCGSARCVICGTIWISPSIWMWTGSPAMYLSPAPPAQAKATPFTRCWNNWPKQCTIFGYRTRER
jgi:hypothetical protein